MSSKPWTSEEISVLQSMNENGFDYLEISNKIARSPSACRQKGRFLGLHGDMNVNFDFFSLETEEKYYILGYWLADGCIMEKSGGHYFSIVSNDKDHLEKMHSIMKIRTKIYKNSNNAYEIRVGSKRLIQSLFDMGCSCRKTENMSLNDLSFDDAYFYVLLRGFFDGDGGYQYSGFTRKDGVRNVSGIKFTGSKIMIESIYDYIGYGTLHPDTRKRDCYYLSFYGDNMRSLLRKMYDKSTIQLNRKYDVFKKFIEIH